MASDAGTTDAPPEEVDYDAFRQVLNEGLDDVATPLIGSYARSREAPRKKMPPEPAHGKPSGHSSKKRRKLQIEPEPATETAPENIVRVSPRTPPATHPAPWLTTTADAEISARGTERR